MGSKRWRSWWDAKKVKKIKKGDSVIFIYDKGVIAVCDVLMTIEENSDFSMAIWNDSQYQNIYFLNNFTEINYFAEGESLLNKIKKILYYKSGTNFQNLIIIDPDHDRHALLDVEMDIIRGK